MTILDLNTIVFTEEYSVHELRSYRSQNDKYVLLHNNLLLFASNEWQPVTLS